MKVSVGLLTYNRQHLLKTTLASIRNTHIPFWLTVMDNGSDDEAATKKVSRNTIPDRTTYLRTAGIPVGTAWNTMTNVIRDTQKPDLFVLSADDYAYKAAWLGRLISAWDAAPDNCAIISCNWEPEYPWNSITSREKWGGQEVLVRATVPGSHWTFRHNMLEKIFPLLEKTGGEDLEALRRLSAQGYIFGALDLTEHIGEKESSWGNQSWKQAKPLKLEEAT